MLSNVFLIDWGFYHIPQVLFSQFFVLHLKLYSHIHFFKQVLSSYLVTQILENVWRLVIRFANL